MSTPDTHETAQAAPAIDASAPLPNGGLEVISIAKSYD
jgi:lipopolysaccharide export system ATP-binding protein